MSRLCELKEKTKSIIIPTCWGHNNGGSIRRAADSWRQSVKRILAIALVVVILAVAAYIIFSEYELTKRKPRESVGKPEPAVRRVSETKESAALKKWEEIYRLAAKKEKTDVSELLASLKDESPMVRLAAARRVCNSLTAACHPRHKCRG